MYFSYRSFIRSVHFVHFSPYCSILCIILYKRLLFWPRYCIVLYRMVRELNALASCMSLSGREELPVKVFNVRFLPHIFSSLLVNKRIISIICQSNKILLHCSSKKFQANKADIDQEKVS